MSAPTLIPSHMRVEGRVETSGDLEIEGRCDGEIVVAGAVVVRPGAVCKALIRARTVTIQGEVIGSVVCTETIVLASGARVVGDVRAPDVSVDPTAKVDGSVDLLAPDPEVGTTHRVHLATRGPKPRRPPTPDPVLAQAKTKTIPTRPRPRGRTRVSQRPNETD